MSMFYQSDGSHYSSSENDAILDDSDMEFQNLLLKYGYPHPMLNSGKTSAKYLVLVQRE